MSGIVVYNASLIKAIKRLDGCTINELKAEYLPLKQPGVVQGVSVMFDNDLQELEKYGAIEIKDGRLSILAYQRVEYFFEGG